MSTCRRFGVFTLLAPTLLLFALLILAACLPLPALAGGPEGRGLEERGLEERGLEERGKTLVIMDVELDGDLDDPSRVADWRRRLATINTALHDDIAQAGLYTVVDTTPAADLMNTLRQRKSAHECAPCLREVAQRLGAERVLTAWVYRMSNLVLTLHAIIWAPASDEIVMSRVLQFRGDNDYAWKRATDYLIHDVEEMQKPPQM